MAGFCQLAGGLQAPNLATSREKSPIVSGGYLKYSRFWETAAGDRVRSVLVAGLTVQTRQILWLCRRETGNSEPALRADGGSAETSWSDPTAKATTAG
jgi:hypothetical protein